MPANENTKYGSTSSFFSSDPNTFFTLCIKLLSTEKQGICLHSSKLFTFPDYILLIKGKKYFWTQICTAILILQNWKHICMKLNNRGTTDLHQNKKFKCKLNQIFFNGYYKYINFSYLSYIAN